VILVDANLLVYAHVSSFLQHPKAAAWLDAQLSGSDRVGLPWSSLLGFLRIVTNPRIFEHPEAMGEAWQQVLDWLEPDVTWIPQPTDGHADILGKLVTGAGVQANLVPDAHLAALAIEHGLLLCSTDGDFGRFADLRWHNPLRPSASRS
jgi:toxin-antitoxin system PIN domain toxin